MAALNALTQTVNMTSFASLNSIYKLGTAAIGSVPNAMRYLAEPVTIVRLAAFLGPFAAVQTLVGNLGFGAAGIVASSSAAAVQSSMYGGFVPAGGIFAIMTGLGMRGLLMPLTTAVTGGIGVAAYMLVGALL